MKKPSPGLAVPTSIKERRDALDWSQEELAAKAGVSTPTIHNLETGKNGFTDKSLAAIARALGCTPADLLTPLAGRQPRMITGDVEILATLARIDGLMEKDIDTAFAVISNAISVNKAGSGSSVHRDQLQPANLRRE
ncbi:MAG: helix-turn-helix domain-containing protein [Mesorhizobium sp.]